MALLPHVATALAISDADGTDGKNIIQGAVISLFDENGDAVILYDDENGSNGSTTKQTDATGRVIVYVEEGEYIERTNGINPRPVIVSGRNIVSYATTAELEATRPAKTGQRAENQELDNSQYVLAAAGYVAQARDITAANGRVWRYIWSPSTEKLKGQSSLFRPFSGLTPTKKNSILKISDDRYRAFVHLGGRAWQVADLVNSGLDSQGNTTPFGWSSTKINDYVEYITWGDAGATSSGTIGELTSTDPAPYIGHKAVQVINAGSYVEVSVQVNQPGANIYLNFAGRNDANIVDVTIDGSTALVNEATTVDTYTPVDLTFRQSKLVASNLPSKASPYIVRFTVSADKNPNSGTGIDRFIFDAITLDGGEFGNPWSERVRPKPWTELTVIEQFEERVGSNGRVYVASVGGTTGTTSPSHTSGTSVDGSVTWTAIARSSFFNEKQTSTIQAEGSQLEYAYEFKKTGDSTFQDVGGNLHGNEYITSLNIYVDGAPRNVSAGNYLVGDNIQFVQNIYAYYGVLPTEDHLADTVLTHSIGGGKINVSHESEYKLPGEFGYHYPAMWPILHYLATDARIVFESMGLVQFGDITIGDYAGQSNPFVGATTDLQMTATGEIYREIGTQVSPSNGSGEYHAQACLTISDYSVNGYENGTTLASAAPNLASRSAASGGESWVSKMYFARSNTDKTESVSVGKVVRSDAEYRIRLFRK